MSMSVLVSIHTCESCTYFKPTTHSHNYYSLSSNNHIPANITFHIHDFYKSNIVVLTIFISLSGSPTVKLTDVGSAV